MKTYNVTIKGTTPLLMHRPSALIGDISKEKTQKEITPMDYAKEGLYINPKGKLYQPATHILGSLIEAGKDQQVVGKKKATYSKIIGYAVSIEPFEIEHKNQNWKVYSCLGVINRGRVLIHRPILNEWELNFNVIFDEEQIPPSILKEVMDRAGKFAGIGDWRPQKKGSFGKFQVTGWKEIKD